MRTVRWSAVAVIALLALYFLMRVAASGCTGSSCDLFIPISLLLPVLVFIAVAITGGAAIAAARRSAWLAWLGISTVLGVAGPIAALLTFKDSPDAFVATATVLELQAAVVALAYTFLRTRPASSR